MTGLYILNKARVQTDVILLEFSKAFDAVSHHRLHIKLYMYGTTGKRQKYMKYSLESRSQEVVVIGLRSE